VTVAAKTEIQPCQERVDLSESSCLFSFDWRIAVIVLGLCCVFAYLRWAKLDTLVWGDPPLWLSEAQRLAVGQVPYRDFAWSYPPFSVLLLGWAMRMFGVSFAVVQACITAISVAVVFLSYAVIRPLIPRFLHLPVLLCLLAVCTTSLMFFNLFSLFTYIPALQTGAAGLFLLLVGLLSYIRTGELDVKTWIAIASGAFIAAYSKPESLIATYSTITVLAIADRYYWFAEKETKDWLWHYAKVGLACIAPTLAAYLWMGAVVGFSDMKAGITGYGLASTACPWWPTGVGLFGAAASIGEAAFVAGALSLTRRRRFVARFGSAYYYGLVVGFVGLLVYFGYVLYGNWELLTGARPILEKIWYSAPSTIWSNAVLLPIMWSSIIVWLYLVLRLLAARQSRLTADFITMLILLTGPVAMSARGWFNWHHSVTSTVPGICYPFFLLLGPYLIWRLFVLAGSGSDLDRGLRSLPAGALAALLIGYALLRIAGAYPTQLSDRPYRGLSTAAGNIHLTDFSVDSEIYRFVIENTSPADTILDIPYGGGINFAAHRLSPLFSTQMVDLRMPDRFLNKDLELIRQHPPKVVIAENGPGYGALYGLQGCTCAFPRFVWVPGTSSVVPGKIFPAIAYIQQNYQVAKVVGKKLLLTPKNFHVGAVAFDQNKARDSQHTLGTFQRAAMNWKYGIALNVPE
jgi:hypothetical protein